MLRLFVATALVAFAILAVAVGLARNTAALLAPVHLILFILVVSLYLLPSGLALYRNCKAIAWIAGLNILLGWTLFGWIIALGWAASGKMRTAPPPTADHHVQPVAGH
ncbi:MAG TPA: superinfection immunity protein [Alloacidobacterium sp.]|nr:superinfection immunity protein [Alloacidobacterium sp.]